MSTKPTLPQWEALYKAAAAIKELSPWTNLWDSDIIMLDLPDRDEPVFCSVMGRIGECYGIGVYPGFDSLADYYRIASAPSELPPMMTNRDARYLLCFFGDREEITPDDREVLRKLGLTFRGRNQWIYFRSVEPGYVPWFIDAAHADLLIAALGQLAAACLDLMHQRVSVDFKHGETLLRSYAPEQRQWLSTAAEMPEVPAYSHAYTIQNELFTAKLKLQKKTNTVLELDMVYMPVPVKDSKDSVPYFPRLVILADRQSGMILDQDLAAPEESAEDKVMGILDRYITANGRPRSLHVRDERMEGMMRDFCQKTDIRLVEGDDMAVINDIILNMSAYFED